ncbi:hypothetical protein ACJRO7_017239 [Eucalyptus globulus]|uniref:Uncharacterized protein n=1 Tax=Eucalyptus globulus TaxID=34317 RepID=A0ABD3KQU8_EUCGL
MAQCRMYKSSSCSFGEIWSRTRGASFLNITGALVARSFFPLFRIVMPAMVGIVVDSSLLLRCWIIRSSRSEVPFLGCRGSRLDCDDDGAMIQWKTFPLFRIARPAMVGIILGSSVLQWCCICRSGGSKVLFLSCKDKRLDGDGSATQGKATSCNDPCTMQIRRALADLGMGINQRFQDFGSIPHGGGDVVQGELSTFRFSSMVV